MKSSLLLVVVVLLCIGGCSTELSLRGDAFYPKDDDPRKTMNWYGSVGGQSNKNGFFVGHHKFPKLGGDG